MLTAPPIFSHMDSKFYPLPLMPTLQKLVETLALIDAGYIGTGDRLWTRHG